MTPESQRIAIAEACGYKDIALRLIAEGTGMDAWVWCSGVIGSGGIEIPRYLTDLNAMHEAEKVLTMMQASKYGHYLIAATGRDIELNEDTQIGGLDVFAIACLSAAQRAEVFLKTLNLWDNSK